MTRSLLQSESSPDRVTRGPGAGTLQAHSQATNASNRRHTTTKLLADSPMRLNGPARKVSAPIGKGPRESFVALHPEAHKSGTGGPAHLSQRETAHKQP